MWTHFMDMHSGGGSKEKWQHIYIEADEKQAKVVFYNRFGHNPERVTCACCGDDYSISEYDSLEQATGYQRGCDYQDGNYVERQDGGGYRPYQTLDAYLKTDSILVIYATDIKPEELIGEVPHQGYIWVD